MNRDLRLYNAAMWKDLKVTNELSSFMEDQLEDEHVITPTFIADMITMLRDMEPGMADPKILGELAEIAKLMRDKRIKVFVI